MTINTEEIGGNRRAARRYPVELPLEYKILSGSRVTASGKGSTRNMSSAGLLFTAEAPVPAGAYVELSVYWPVPTPSERPITLMAQGRVVRSEENRVAVRVSRYEFEAEQRYLLRRAPVAGRERASLRVARAQVVPGEYRARPSILVVESFATQNLIRALLERKGYSVLGYSATRARRILKKRDLKVDLLITDHPEEFADFPRLPIVCLTTSDVKLDEAMRAHCVLLHKPFTYPELLQAIGAVLEPGAQRAI